MDSGKQFVFALGFFDGVHLGHAALFNMAKKRAKELGASPAVMTFDTHPDSLIKGLPARLINSVPCRVGLINRLFGIDRVLVIHFDREMMTMAPRKFVDWLIKDHGACHFVVGYDFRYGDRGSGTPQTLTAYAENLGLGCDVIDPVMIEGQKVSSTDIRALIEAGEMEKAAEYMGHPHVLEDKVRQGFHLGRTMNLPTVNMRIPEDVLVPRLGVYATRITLEEETYQAVTNVGNRPTFDRREGVTVESYILDFSREVYGSVARVEFLKFLRPERKFENAESLAAAIAKDVESTKAYFGRPVKG